MKTIFSLLFITATFSAFAQTTELSTITHKLIDLNEVTDSNEDFSGYEDLKELLEGVEIVMLGEQSHGEGTTFDTKIKLVKYLHEEMGFEILAFESGLYECQKAWSLINEGEDIRLTMGKSIFGVWSTIKEIIPLTNYIEKKLATDRPLILAGFDHQIIKLGAEHLVKDLENYLNEIGFQLQDKSGLNHLQNTLELLTKAKFKDYKKNAALKDIAFIDELIVGINSLEQDSMAAFWIQVLKSTKYYFSDIKLKTDYRDQQMAENLIWLKEQNPGKKIICWGATSHFLYNSSAIQMDKMLIQLVGGNYYKKQPMMGEYIKQKYKSKVYTIGFTAYEGHYGINRRKKLKTPLKNSLEHLLGESKYDNCLLPLKDLTIAPYLSRPLGNFYMKTDIAEVMDAVIFNRQMRMPKQDWLLFSKVYPENKYIAKFLEKNESE